ncbi:hypothetical protein Bca4012_054082 [Brassica carinata]
MLRREPGRTPSMFLSVTSTLFEVKERLASSVLVSTNRLQTRSLGSVLIPTVVCSWEHQFQAVKISSVCNRLNSFSF